jgi:cytochrome c553
MQARVHCPNTDRQHVGRQGRWSWWKCDATSVESPPQGYSANPRLRGQTAAYLMTTMNEFRNGKRGNSPGMTDLLRAYSADEVKAIAVYLSSVD